MIDLRIFFVLGLCFVACSVIDKDKDEIKKLADDLIEEAILEGDRKSHASV